jgi:hypothetical protein
MWDIEKKDVEHNQKINKLFPTGKGKTVNLVCSNWSPLFLYG